MALNAVFTLIDRYGTTRTFERLDPPGPAGEAPARSMKRRAQEVPLEGDVSQQNIQIYVRHSTLASAGFPVPPVKGDRVKEGASIHTARAVEELYDDNGVVGGYRLWCRGL